MPELSRFLGIVITTFYRDDGPPHFHATYGDFDIETCGAPNKPLEPTAGMRWSLESRRSFTRPGSAAER